MSAEIALRIRTFSKIEKKFTTPPRIQYLSPQVIYCQYPSSFINTYYSGVNDTKGNLIWQGDIVKLSGHNNVDEYIGVVFMEQPSLNEKIFMLKPAWKTVKSDSLDTSSDTEYFIDIDTPTRGDKKIKGLFLMNNYPINKENGTGFSDGTISEVIGNIFENELLIIPYSVSFRRNLTNPFEIIRPFKCQILNNSK